MQSVPPLFVKDSDIGVSTITPYEMCTAAIRATSTTSLEGVQKINGLWRIYFNNRTTRLQLYSKQSILINGKNVPLYDQNPYTSGQLQSGGTLHTTTQINDKLTIKNVPLSVSNDMIKQMLEEKGIVLVSAVKYGCVRTLEGQLTNYKNGDRFVYAKPFSPPLSRKQTVGNFPCIVIHHGKDMLCIACSEKGHKVGDTVCKAKPTEDILAFKTYQHCLSNHFPCTLRVFEEQFKSVEHAYFWCMAKDFGHHDLAARIKDSDHAGQAKRLSKQIAEEDERWKWEKDNIDVMEAPLKAKSEQCPQFYDCLMENKEKVLAEAGPSRFWASGMSPFITENCAPTYWPGQNMLGALLKELTHALLTKEQQSVESSDQLGNQDGNSVKQDNDIDEIEDEESERTVTEKELNDKNDNQMEVVRMWYQDRIMLILRCLLTRRLLIHQSMVTVLLLNQFHPYLPAMSQLLSIALQLDLGQTKQRQRSQRNLKRKNKSINH